MDEREAALAHVVLLDAPEEVLGRTGESQCLGGQFLREGIELQTVEGDQRGVHEVWSCSVGM